MADYSIALGVKPLQLEDPLTSYGRFAAIQNAQNQNALAQYQLSAAKRSDEESNALRKLFANPENVDQTSPEFIRRIYGVSPEAGLKYEKSIFERKKEQGIFDKTESELLTSELNRAKGLIGQAQTPEELAPIVSNLYNPKTRTGKYFSSLGLDVNTALSAIAQTKNNPQAFYTLLESFASSGDKLIDNLRARAEEAQMRPQPRFGGAPTETPAPQENALGMRLGTSAPTPTQTALGAPVAGVANTTAVSAPQLKTRSLSFETEPPAPVAAPEAEAATTFAKQRLALVEKKIGDMQTVLASFPGNQRAAEALKAAVDERNKLVAEDLASQKFKLEQKTAIEYIKAPEGVIKVDKVNGTSEFVLGPDGKRVMDVSAAQAAETVRSNAEREKADRARLGLERQRVALQLQADARAEYQAKQPKFDASAGGFVYSPSAENPQGKFVAVTGIEGKAPNEAQGNAIAYGARMNGANKILEGLEGKGIVSGGRIKGAVAGALEALVPYQGEKLAAGAESVLRPLLSSEGQNNYEQAKENFITAVLRKESGASISPAEFAREERKYFPQFNDDASTIKQKQEARRLAISAIRQVAGPFAKNIDAISSGAAGGPASGAATGADPLGLRK
jgi:hypothetical protein